MTWSRKEINDSGRVKYFYQNKCPVCGVVRELQNKKDKRCSSCAGRQSYMPPVVKRDDQRVYGDGYITKQGYHLVYNGDRYIPAHREIVGDIPEKHVVHHIDGNKLNNDLDNLKVMSKVDHRELHGQLERVSYFLIQTGVIVFDGNKYSVDPSVVKSLKLGDDRGDTFGVTDRFGNTSKNHKVGRVK